MISHIIVLSSFCDTPHLIIGNPGFLNSPTLDHIGACKTILSLQILSKKKKKNIFFTILGSREKPLENFTFDLDVPKSILLGEDEEQ